MYCINCGQKMEDGATVCPNCCTPITEPTKATETPIVAEPTKATETQIVAEPTKAPKPKREIDISPLTIVGSVMSSIAFLLGLILISVSLANYHAGRPAIDLLIALPMLVGISLSTYCLVAFKKKKGDFLLNIISLGMSTFTLLYMFISLAAIMG